MAGAELSVDDTLHLLRTRVLGVALNVLAIAMPLVSVFLALQAYQGGTLNRLTLLMCAWVLVFPLLRVAAPAAPVSCSALCLLCMLVVSGAMVALRGGLTVGCLPSASSPS